MLLIFSTPMLIRHLWQLKVVAFQHRFILLGNCDKFYFTFKFEVRMCVQIDQIFEKDRMPICPLSNKSNLNTDKPKDF